MRLISIMNKSFCNFFEEKKDCNSKPQLFKVKLPKMTPTESLIFIRIRSHDYFFLVDSIIDCHWSCYRCLFPRFYKWSCEKSEILIVKKKEKTQTTRMKSSKEWMKMFGNDDRNTTDSTKCEKMIWRLMCCSRSLFNSNYKCLIRKCRGKMSWWAVLYIPLLIFWIISSFDMTYEYTLIIMCQC